MIELHWKGRWGSLSDAYYPTKHHDTFRELLTEAGLTHIGQKLKVKDVEAFNRVAQAKGTELKYTRGPLDQTTLPGS